MNLTELLCFIVLLASQAIVSVMGEGSYAFGLADPRGVGRISYRQASDAVVKQECEQVRESSCRSSDKFTDKGLVYSSQVSRS